MPERDRDAVGFTRHRGERGDGRGDDDRCGRGDAGDARVDARDERSGERAHRGRARVGHARVSHGVDGTRTIGDAVGRWDVGVSMRAGESTRGEAVSHETGDVDEAGRVGGVGGGVQRDAEGGCDEEWWTV